MGHFYTLICVIAAIRLLSFRPAGAQDKIRVGLSSISATSGSLYDTEYR